MFRYWQERKSRKEKVKRLKRELKEVEVIRHKLLEDYKLKYNNRLYEAKKVKIIESNSSEEFENKYNSIKGKFERRESAMYLGDYDMIGELVRVRYGEPIYKNGIYSAIINYTEYELEEDLSVRDYNNAINELRECDKKYYKLKEAIDKI